MYISKIHLENIRCFEEIELDLTGDAGIRNWAVILGDNGLGKTTLLRSIAVGLCDRTSAAGLISDLQGDWIRQGARPNTGKIRITLRDPQNKRKFHSEIEISNGGGREQIEIKKNPVDDGLDDILVCAYGAARGVQGTRDYRKYRTQDSVYTLFDYETGLQNPELILRRLASREANINEILESIDKILMLDSGSTELDTSGISIKGPWGNVPFSSVGDGYRSTLTWVTDFLGWAMFHYDKVLDRDKLHGIVLLDEIEQHLHPIWQRHIVRLLSEQFPNIQFIGTSHSPLCASGSADLKEEEYRLVVLDRGEHNGSVEVNELASLRGLRADQVLTSTAFGLEETRNPSVEKELQQFRRLLLSNSLNSAEEKELARLRHSIENQFPGLAEREEDRALERELWQRMRNHSATNEKSGE